MKRSTNIFLTVTISLIAATLVSTINGQFNPYYPNNFYPNNYYPNYPGYPNYPNYPNFNQGQCPQNLMAPTNGFMSNNCIGTIGYTCSFSCASGYTLSGSSSVTCLSPGYWSSSAPTCTSSSRRVVGYLSFPNRWG
ncbi:P-selectin-like [Panonychus citri]|uniref:P-selectin-like n=1 Tax=Panonychus citri TaxID=50023 RepID=UPI002307E40E|nr:P-selectin-like [Panonychus citri]